MISTSPKFHVEVVKFKDPIGQTTHALLKCPRCLKGIGVTMAMLLGMDSIICKGAHNLTGVCNGHYYFDVKKRTLKFMGTVPNKVGAVKPTAIGFEDMLKFKQEQIHIREV